MFQVKAIAAHSEAVGPPFPHFMNIPLSVLHPTVDIVASDLCFKRTGHFVNVVLIVYCSFNVHSFKIIDSYRNLGGDRL